MSDTLSATIAQLRSLREKATPGEWHWADPWNDGCVRHASRGTNPPDFFHADLPDANPKVLHTPAERLADAAAYHGMEAGFCIRDADAALIAAAVNALPLLLGELERLEEMLRHLEWYDDGDFSLCPVCDGQEPVGRWKNKYGHTTDCELAAALQRLASSP